MHSVERRAVLGVFSQVADVGIPQILSPPTIIRQSQAGKNRIHAQVPILARTRYHPVDPTDPQHAWARKRVAEPSLPRFPSWRPSSPLAVKTIKSVEINL